MTQGAATLLLFVVSRELKAALSLYSRWHCCFCPLTSALFHLERCNAAKLSFAVRIWSRAHVVVVVEAGDPGSWDIAHLLRAANAIHVMQTQQFQFVIQNGELATFNTKNADKNVDAEGHV